MKAKKIQKSTRNRGEFNRAYKSYLEHCGKIGCSYCRYHRGENRTTDRYDGYDDVKNIKHPNWKLVSKNKKQWEKKIIKFVYKPLRRNDGVYIEIKF